MRRTLHILTLIAQPPIDAEPNLDDPLLTYMADPNTLRALQGVARALVESVAQWARSAGCAELASDSLLDNPLAHAAHRALGFEETERVVYFRRALSAE